MIIDRRKINNKKADGNNAPAFFIGDTPTG
jgi:hypothetical protein